MKTLYPSSPARIRHEIHRTVRHEFVAVYRVGELRRVPLGVRCEPSVGSGRVGALAEDIGRQVGAEKGEEDELDLEEGGSEGDPPKPDFEPVVGLGLKCGVGRGKERVELKGLCRGQGSLLITWLDDKSILNTTKDTTCQQDESCAEHIGHFYATSRRQEVCVTQFRHIDITPASCG